MPGSSGLCWRTMSLPPRCVETDSSLRLQECLSDGKPVRPTPSNLYRGWADSRTLTCRRGRTADSIRAPREIPSTKGRIYARSLFRKPSWRSLAVRVGLPGNTRVSMQAPGVSYWCEHPEQTGLISWVITHVLSVITTTLWVKTGFPDRKSPARRRGFRLSWCSRLEDELHQQAALEPGVPEVGHAEARIVGAI